MIWLLSDSQSYCGKRGVLVTVGKMTQVVCRKRRTPAELVLRGFDVVLTFTGQGWPRNRIGVPLDWSQSVGMGRRCSSSE